MIIRYYFFSALFLFFAFSSKLVAEDYTSRFCKQYSSPAQKANIIGEVRDAKTNKPLYCEYHIFEGTDNKKVLVEYRNPDQALIATKRIDYSQSPIRPNVIQKDFRHNELRSAMLDASGLDINISYRKPNKDDVKSIRITSSDDLVIDAGFDQAIREHWPTLIDGDKLIMKFLSPVHLNTIKLTVKKSSAKRCYKEAYDRETQACFLIKPSNLVLNLIVKPLALVYELESKRLLQFSGAVNITNEKGGTQNALIKYYYES